MAVIYNAPKPSYTNWQWFNWITIRTIFLPVLLWDVLKWLVNKIAGNAIGKLVLEAQSRIAYHYPLEQTFSRFHIKTHDNVELDTLLISPDEHSENTATPDEQKYIINLVGNGMCYEDILDEMKFDANFLKVSVIGFNHRGVGYSSGHPQSKDDLVTDCIAQVQYLLDVKHTLPQNIILKGHSLGAGIASITAHHFHQQGIPIKIFNGRSFSSVTNVVVGQIRKGLHQQDPAETVFLKIVGWMAKPFVKLVLSLAKWEINADVAFRAIPKEYREYLVVKTSKEGINDLNDKSPKHDMVITSYASLHAALKDERKADKYKLDQLITETANVSETNDPLAKAQLATMTATLKLARLTFSKRKLERFTNDPHNQSWHSLKNRHSESAIAFFSVFVKRKTSADDRPQEAPTLLA